MRSMNDEFDRALAAAGAASTGPRGMPRVGVTARITPPSMTTKPMTPTMMRRLAIDDAHDERAEADEHQDRAVHDVAIAQRATVA